MTRLWITIIGLVMIVGIFGITSAHATSLSTDIENTPSTLTVMFRPAPEEFGSGALVNVETRAKSSMVGAATNSSGADKRSVSPAAAVPEPSTVILVGLGILGLFGLARRKKS
ncbi:PEP-CTERM sorting domain-containing protein [candidate division KSB1 bacterium]|nr:PEP-CTERM sorting domain-containing protein [candidate division KSB1 bacterium]